MIDVLKFLTIAFTDGSSKLVQGPVTVTETSNNTIIVEAPGTRILLSLRAVQFLDGTVALSEVEARVMAEGLRRKQRTIKEVMADFLKESAI